MQRLLEGGKRHFARAFDRETTHNQLFASLFDTFLTLPEFKHGLHLMHLVKTESPERTKQKKSEEKAEENLVINNKNVYVMFETRSKTNAVSEEDYEMVGFFACRIKPTCV